MNRYASFLTKATIKPHLLNVMILSFLIPSEWGSIATDDEHGIWSQIWL